MKRVLVGALVLLLTFNCDKLNVEANQGFTLFMDNIDVKPIECAEYIVPNYSGFKSYMTYKKFSKSSEQYSLQQLAITDEYGFRRFEDYYIIAMGSFFGAKVGQRVDLVLENGEVIKCVIGDAKADNDTDASNIFSKNNCLSEFLVDTKKLEPTVKGRGDVSHFPNEQWDSPVTEVIVYEEYLLED